MKYIKDENLILISSREFVKTARRKISSTLPIDSEEGLGSSASKFTLHSFGIEKSMKIEHTVVLSDFSLKIIATADACDYTLVSRICEGSFNPQRPPRAVKEQARAEAYIFAYIYAKQHGYKSMNINTVYVNEDSGEFEKKSEDASFSKLEGFFEKCLLAVLTFAKPEIDRVTRRMPLMKKLKFPYRKIRDSQREFIETAHKNLTRGGTLFATAPTGTGKTVSALYPAVRAMGEGKISKTFYLTPKTTTAAVAKECIELFSRDGLCVLAVILTAKEKICTNSSLCKGGSHLCKYCSENNLAKAALHLYEMQIPVIGEDIIRGVGEEYSVCPYELSLAYSELCDVVICDFNYLFDTSVYIRRYFDEGGEYAFLIDEAHNLPDRAREIFSAEISEESIISPALNPVISEHSAPKKLARVWGKTFYDLTLPYLRDEIYKNERGEKIAFAHLKEIPPEYYTLFSEILSQCENALYQEFLAKDDEKDARLKALRDYLYKIKKFSGALERFSDSYELFLYLEGDAMRAKIFCIDTGRDIAEKLRKGRSAIFFSATLSPLYYYKSVLGNDSTAELLSLPSPFDTSQASISIVDSISTRYSEREDTLGAICRAVASTVSAKRGNYIIFTPSFEYNERLSQLFKAKYPKLNIITQTKNMSKAEKDAFLSEFSKENSSYLIAFCVMGGLYSEGIDLAGDKLIGAVIVGIGMPSLSVEREAIEAYYNEKFEEGKQFAYIYPGMNRVLQATGRVIRTEDDKGVIVLIDDRFRDPIYKKVIPSFWSGMRFISDLNILNSELKKFWSE